MSTIMSRPVWIAVLIASILGSLVILRLLPSGAMSPSPLGNAQLPAALTQAAFTKDHELLPAIHAEAQRRLLGAGRYLGDVSDVLPPPLLHLYVIISYEQLIRARVDLAQLPIMTAPPSPMLPPVAALEKAYLALNEPIMADLAKSLAANPSSHLTGPFLAAMDKPEVLRQRLAFARSHQEDLLQE